jgi:hypothetical protein
MRPAGEVALVLQPSAGAAMTNKRRAASKPLKSSVRTGKELAKILGTLKLPDAEAVSWQEDLKDAKKVLKPPKDKWI